MKKKKMILLILVAVLLVAGCLQSVYANSGCPKGKACTSRGCGLYSDTNGNGLCDLVEGSTDVSNDQEDVSIDQEVDSSLVAEQNQQTSGETAVEKDVQTIDDFTIQNEISVDTSTIEEASASEGSSTTQEEADPDQNFSINNLLQIIKSNILIIAYAIFLTVGGIISKLNISRKKNNALRMILLISSLGILGFYFGGCICPIGGLQNLPLKLAGVISGDYIYWLLLMILPILFIFFAGRVFCSSVCPLGAAQELLFVLGKKLGFNNGQPGLKKMPWLRYVKYFVLVWLIVFTAITGYTLFCKYDPFVTLFTLKGTLLSVVSLILIIGLSMFVSRPWCRIICPYGALLGIINKMAVHWFHLAAIPGADDIRCKSCNGCGICIKECPVDAIQVSKNTRNQEVTLNIDACECINCKKCL